MNSSGKQLVPELPRRIAVEEPDCGRALSWRHQTTVRHVVVLPAHSPSPLNGRREASSRQGGFASDARRSCYSPATVLPSVVHLRDPHAIASSNNELRGNRRSSTNREIIYPHDDDEAALLDAIDAGDCDRDGNPISYPRYRGA